MNKINIGNDLYLKGRIGWRGLSKDEYLSEGNYRIINATALEDNFIDWSKCGFISKERYDESPEIQLKENDILISKDGTLGKVGYVKHLEKPSTVASGVFVLRNTKEDILDTDYLYHFLKSKIFKDFVYRNKAMGSTINHLYQRDLSELEIDRPILSKQKKVSNVLLTIDKKIEINKEVIDELDILIKTVFDYWFLQYEFPNESNKPYRTSDGKLVYNNKLKKDIPKGWKDGKLKQLGEIVSGGTPSTKKSEYYCEEGIAWITPYDLSNTDNKYIANGERDITEEGLNNSSAKLMPKGSVLISTRAPIGYLAIALNEVTTNQGFKSIVPKTEYSSEYVYYTLRTNIKGIEQQGSGTTFKEVSKEIISNYKIIFPKQEVIDKFNIFIKPLSKKMIAIEKENTKLIELRDWLLPMLMNGQVTFK